MFSLNSQAVLPTSSAEGQDQHAYKGQRWRQSEETDTGPQQQQDTINKPTEEVSEVENALAVEEARTREVLKWWPRRDAEHLEPLDGCTPKQHGRNVAENAPEPDARAKMAKKMTEANRDQLGKSVTYTEAEASEGEDVTPVNSVHRFGRDCFAITK